MTLPNFPSASTRYLAAHNSGQRNPKGLCYVVIHATEGETAQGAAEWFEDPRSEGSANMVVGDYVAFRTLPDDVIPWAAPPLNTLGYHIEIAGYSAWTKEHWNFYRRRIQNAAYRAALRCIAWKIPAVWLGVPELLDGKHGLTSHANVSAAWHKTNHTDPGANFPYDYFTQCVQEYVKTKSV